MEILILSKTKFGKLACVGGVCLSNAQYVRLMQAPHQYQPSSTDFEIGQIYDINFTAVPDAPPHVEDVVVNDQTFLRSQTNLKSFIQKQGYQIWDGSIETCFDGLLHWTSGGSGYVGKNQCLPNHSIGFWKPDRSLSFGSPYYNYSNTRRLKYVGYQNAVPSIPANSLVRVSLAKWWTPQETPEVGDRCYLQLSGWY